MGNCFEAWMELHWRSLFSGAKSKEVPALPGSQREKGFVYPRNFGTRSFSLGAEETQRCFRGSWSSYTGGERVPGENPSPF